MFTRSALYRQEKCSDKVRFRLTWDQRQTDLTEKGITDNITGNSTLGFQNIQYMH